MGKFFGEIGYAVTTETSPGVWTPSISTREYFGDVIRNTRRIQSSGSVNDDLNVSVTISVIADPFAYENFHNIRYVVYMGTKWKATDVDVQYPRLNITLGGVYNG
jgi:hypothetical protein